MTQHLLDENMRKGLAMTKHVWCCLAVAILLVTCALGSPSIGTPLDDYVYQVDSHYRWSDTGKRLKGLIPWERWEGAVLEMTSQAWLSPAEVDCSVWTHNLVVVIPGNYAHKKTALLVVGDGSNTGELPCATDELMILAATVAVKTKSLVAVLYQVPNQPCHFTAEHPRRGRSEDDLIAYTWAHFLEHPDRSEWLLRLPMTKAVVRGMDTVQSFAEALGTKLENFVVTGASKRSWTAWMTAAVDDRVVGVIPIVMDSLNFNKNIHHFYQALGGWPVSFKSYYDMNLTAKIDNPEFWQLMAIVDPYQYKDRFTMPKLIISTSNDEFFLIDDSSYFWDDLPGEKHMLILSNTEHSLLTGIPKLLMAVEAFYLSIVDGHELSSTDRGLSLRSTSLLQMPVENRLQERRPGFGGRPKYSWHINKRAGTVEIGVAEKPIKVILWYAYTRKGTKARDFRWFSADTGNCPTVAVKGFCMKPVFFYRRTLKPSGLDSRSGWRNYYASIPFPKEGYGAFYAELRFAGPTVLTPFVFTTGAVIVPDVFPFDDCHGEMCKEVFPQDHWRRSRIIINEERLTADSSRIQYDIFTMQAVATVGRTKASHAVEELKGCSSSAGKQTSRSSAQPSGYSKWR